MVIPFVGWSSAGQEFRRIVEEKAKKRISVLIVGEHGVGKRTMAAIWRATAGQSEKVLPVVNLDTTSDIPSPCIAISTRAPASGRDTPADWRTRYRTAEAFLYHLDTGGFAPVPPEECRGDSLPDALASRFGIRLYMPPLRRRQIDILAVLHFYAVAILKPSWTHVNSAIIHRMLLNSSWPGNIASLVEYLRARRESRGDVLVDEPVDCFPVRRPDADQHFRRIILPSGMPDTNWSSEDVAVPVNELPRVGLSIVLARALDDAADPHHLGRCGYSTAPQYPLGPDQMWSDSSAWALINDLGRASMEELLVAYAGGFRPRSGFPPELISVATRFRDFGSSIDSIQAGLAVGPSIVSLKLYAPNSLQPPKRKQVRIRKATRERLTEKQKKICDLYGEGLLQKDIANIVGASPSHISKVLRGVQRKNRSLWTEIEKSHERNRPRRSKERRALPTDRRGQPTLAAREVSSDEE